MKCPLTAQRSPVELKGSTQILFAVRETAVRAVGAIALRKTRTQLRLSEIWWTSHFDCLVSILAGVSILAATFLVIHAQLGFKKLRLDEVHAANTMDV